MLIIIIVAVVISFCQGKTRGGSKITEVNYKIVWLVVINKIVVIIISISFCL